MKVSGRRLRPARGANGRNLQQGASLCLLTGRDGAPAFLPCEKSSLHMPDAARGLQTAPSPPAPPYAPMPTCPLFDALPPHTEPDSFADLFVDGAQSIHSGTITECCNFCAATTGCSGFVEVASGNEPNHRFPALQSQPCRCCQARRRPRSRAWLAARCFFPSMSMLASLTPSLATRSRARAHFHVARYARCR